MKQVKCIDDFGYYGAITEGKTYDVVGESKDFWIVISDKGKVRKFPKNKFELLKIIDIFGWIRNVSNNQKGYEPVLEIAYEKAHDIWFGKITKQNTDVLVRGKFINTGIGIDACSYPHYNYKEQELHVRGMDTELDNEVFRIGSDYHKGIVEGIVRQTNNHYMTKRKSWKEMIDECEEVPFVKSGKNYYVSFNHEDNGVGKFVDQEVEDYKKYISKEDAERIIKECAENNR